MSEEKKSSLEEKQSKVNFRRLFIAAGMPLLTVGMCIVCMYSAKNSMYDDFLKSQQSLNESMLASANVAYYSYIYENIEYQYEELLGVVSEPCLVTMVTTLTDGTSSFEDCYVTFSAERDEPLTEYRNGVLTLVIPREDKN